MAASGSRLATTTAVGASRATSAAKLGPDITQKRSMTDPGKTLPSTSSMGRTVSSSIPLEALTTSASSAMWGAARAITPPTNWEGLTETTSSAPSTAAARSGVARRFSGSVTPSR